MCDIPNMATPRGKSAWSGLLLLLVVACAPDTAEVSTSSTAPITVYESTDQPAPTPADSPSETVITSAPHSESTTTLVPTAPATTDYSAATPTTLPAAATTIPLATTAPPPTSQDPTITLTTTSTTATALPDDLTVVEVLVREGRVVSEDRVDVPLGNRISLRIDSDARLLVHIHGYDEEFSVAADVLTVYEFQGDLPGIFEVEDHVTHRLLIELKVSP